MQVKGCFPRDCGMGIRDGGVGKGALVAIAGVEWLRMDPFPTSLMYEKSLLQDWLGLLQELDSQL